MKIQKIRGAGSGGGVGGRGRVGGGQGGCERSIEVFVKIQKINFWGEGVRWGSNWGGGGSGWM